MLRKFERELKDKKNRKRRRNDFFVDLEKKGKDSQRTVGIT